jgi:predicted acyl esterase
VFVQSTRGTFGSGGHFRRFLTEHAGHRLRVQVAGGAFPRFARNLGTAEPFPSAVEGRPCRFEVFADPIHPSRLELPVLG